MIFDFPCRVERYNKDTKKFEYFASASDYRKAVKVVRSRQEEEEIPYRIERLDSTNKCKTI